MHVIRFLLHPNLNQRGNKPRRGPLFYKLGGVCWNRIAAAEENVRPWTLV